MAEDDRDLESPVQRMEASIYRTKALALYTVLQI